MSTPSLLNQIEFALDVLTWTKEDIDAYQQKYQVQSVKKALRPNGDPTRSLPAILSRRTREAYIETALTFFTRAKGISGKGLLSELMDIKIILETFDRFYRDKMPDTNKTVLAALEKVYLGCRRLRWIRTPSPITDNLRQYVSNFRDDGDVHLPRFGYAEGDAERILARLWDKGSQFALPAEIALRCGLRLAEVAGMKGSDIDSAHDQLYIKGKGGKERIIPIPHDLVEKLDLSKQFLFVPSATWKNSFYAAVRKAARELDIRISGIHRLRSNWAQKRFLDLLAKGYTEKEARDIVAREAGHGRRDVTFSYIPKGYGKRNRRFSRERQ